MRREIASNGEVFVNSVSTHLWLIANLPTPALDATRKVEGPKTTDDSDILDHHAVDCILSWIIDPIDLIGMSVTNRTFRARVNIACQMRIKALFGEETSIEAMNAVAVAAKLWAPLKPRTQKLAKIIPLKMNNPISSQMKAVLTAAEKGTVEELRTAIRSLNDPSELTELKFGAESGCLDWELPLNPLQLAVQSGEIEKVRLLIDFGTPIGAGVEGRIPYSNSPLFNAATEGQAAMVQLLLENGASFSVKMDLRIDEPSISADYSPKPMLLVMFDSINFWKSDNLSLHIAGLAMRSWRQEVGGEAIRKDNKLAEWAGQLCLVPSSIKFAKLLTSYGVIPVGKN